MLINIHSIFIWIGNPKPHLWRFRLAAGAFCFENRYAFFRKVYFYPNQCFVIILNDYADLLKTRNRRGTQFHAEKQPNLVLSSHLDPIGDQDDV